MSLLRQGVMALGAGAIAATLLAFSGPAFRGEADAAVEPIKSPAVLKPVSSFDKIKDKNKRAVALFEEAGKVIQSPRCMNCHPATERPTQTDRMRPHMPLVVRGEGSWRGKRAGVQYLSPRCKLRRCGRTRQSEVGFGTSRDGLAGQVARPDLRADQGQGTQRRQGHGRAGEAHG